MPDKIKIKSQKNCHTVNDKCSEMKMNRKGIKQRCRDRPLAGKLSRKG